MSSLRRYKTLKRVPIRRRPRRRVLLTHEQWLELRTRVEARDREVVLAFIEKQDPKLAALWRMLAKQLPWCPAVVMDPFELGSCSGRWELDHVHDPAKPMKGKKPPDDEDHLLALCTFHHRGIGDKRGRIWATANRDKEWAYLLERRAA